MTELTGVTWRKSTRSNEGNCVEVAGDLAGSVGDNRRPVET